MVETGARAHPFSVTCIDCPDDSRIEGVAEHLGIEERRDGRAKVIQADKAARLVDHVITVSDFDFASVSEK